jgi:DNA-directed RNA polymerase specialized sigma24 family protein
MLDGVSKDDFEHFLLTLDSDKDNAAEKFLRLRAGIESFFEWRDCENIEELTDIVFDRVVRKIVAGEEVENIEAFSVSIARFVVLEHKRKSVRMTELNEIEDRESFADRIENDDLKRRNIDCLRKCLGKLPEKKRRLLLEYFDTEETTMITKRRGLAEKLELSLNSLRIRVSRLKSKLERCTKDCCEK